MELNTSNVSPSLVYSDADREGNAGGFDPDDCPCPNLYKRLYPGQTWNPDLNRYVLNGPRFELIASNYCYCARYTRQGGLGTVRDHATGLVPYGFQVDGELALDFTGSGNGASLKWVGGSLSSGDDPGLVGRNEHKYPKGWQLIVTGMGGVETGVLPDGIANYYLSGENPEGHNGFNRTTQNLPFKGRAPISLENEIVLDNTETDIYLYKDCVPAISFGSFAYVNGGETWTVNTHACDAQGITSCSDATPSSDWKLKVIEDGVGFTRIILGNKSYSDGDILPVSDGPGTWSDSRVSVEASVTNQGTDYFSSFAYATFASGTGSDDLEGTFTSCDWASGLGGPFGTPQPYNCMDIRVGQCGLASAGNNLFLSPIPPQYTTNVRGYPYSIMSPATIGNSHGGGGTFVISGGASSLADDYYPVEFGGDIDFIMAGTYCNFDPNNGWNRDFISSGGASTYSGTISGEGYWFKKGKPFNVWLTMVGTGQWTTQRMQTVNPAHATLPRFTKISLFGDPTGSMVAEGPIYRQLGSRPSLPISQNADYSFSRFQYRSPAGSSIGVPVNSGILINFGGMLSGESQHRQQGWPNSKRSLNVFPASSDGRSIFRRELRKIPSEYPLPLWADTAEYVRWEEPNAGLLEYGSLGGAPADLPLWFGGDPITGGAFTSWTELATGRDFISRSTNLGIGMYAYNGYSGVNTAYRGVEFLPYESTISNCERVPGLTDTFWCTGDSFSLSLHPNEGMVAAMDWPTLAPAAGGNIVQSAGVRGQREAYQALQYMGGSGLRDYWSLEGFEFNALEKILGMQAAQYGQYLGYVYHVPVGIFLNYNGWEAGHQYGSLGRFPHYMLNAPSAGGSITNAWYHNADITEQIQSALPSSARWLTGISSYTDSYNFLENIPVSLCISGAATMSSAANPSLVVAIGTFWAYDELTGGLNFPGFTAHNPSTPLQKVQAGDVQPRYPLYNPLWGGVHST